MLEVCFILEPLGSCPGGPLTAGLTKSPPCATGSRMLAFSSPYCGRRKPQAEPAAVGVATGLGEPGGGESAAVARGRHFLHLNTQVRFLHAWMDRDLGDVALIKMTSK